MRFLYGFVGAILGSLLGLALLVLAVTVSQEGHLPDAAFMSIAYAPIGLSIGAILGVIAGILVWRFIRANPNSKQAKRRIGGADLIVCVLIPAMLWGAHRDTLAPSDGQLIANFRRHRAAFDAMVRMSQADKGFASISRREDVPGEAREEGISPNRAEQYRRLLDEAEIRRLAAGTEGYGVRFSCWFQGSGQTEDYDKGYAYLPVPPKLFLGSLDNYQPKVNDEDEVFRHIEGHWYLYYEYLP